MKKFYDLILISLLLAIINAVNAMTPASPYKYKIKLFQVPLDHFSYTQNTTFSIRYLVNDSFVRSDKANVPILFYTGNEGDIELFAQNTGFMWEIAPELGAMLIFAEHRYYGQSMPFGNKSYDSPEHLGYLTSEQALADFADLLQEINPSSANRPVIALGGSYGGMLAAWFRMKYPHLVQGAIASSAPILQFGQITPCDVFNRILTSVFTTAYKAVCSDNIRRSWSVLKNYTSTPEGRTYLEKKFNLCANLTKPEDYKTISEYLTDVYGNLAMANYPYANSFLAPLPAYPVREFCGRLDKKFEGKDLIDGLQLAVSVYSNYTGKTKCLDINSAYDKSMGDEGWSFQACTEMVMPMCSNGETDFFEKESWDLKQYSDDCFKKFKVRPRANAAQTMYGGNGLEGASNIVFSNGLLDPWSGGGVLRTRNDQIQIRLIPDGAHHLDLRGSNENDPGSVIEVRKSHIFNIRKWIKDHYKKRNYVNPIFSF